MVVIVRVLTNVLTAATSKRRSRDKDGGKLRIIHAVFTSLLAIDTEFEVTFCSTKCRT